MTLAMGAELRASLTPHLPAPDEVGEYGEQWGDPDRDGWQVSRTDDGIDAYTQPVEELTVEQAEAAGLALLAAAARGRAARDAS